jgi:hypothetical protein
LDQLFTDVERHGVHIKRLTGAVGSLSRWNKSAEPERDPNAPPDPKTDPDGWRAWARRSVKPNLGELQ